MKWTFGIPFGCWHNNIYQILYDIKAEFKNIDYEVILVGPDNPLIDLTEYKARIINFDNDEKPAWITKKKNIIAQNAQNDLLCVMHDYITLEKGWFDGFNYFGYDWDVCMNPILTVDKLRFRDWVTWEPVKFVDYSDHSRIRDMYVSGSYFCVKKEFLLNNPLDETKRWGESEDVEWSLRCRDKWNYKCNPYSKVKLLKWKDRYPT
jgi:hypothetical protein